MADTNMNLTKVVYNLKDEIKELLEKINATPNQWFGNSEEFKQITEKDTNTVYFVLED